MDTVSFRRKRPIMVAEEHVSGLSGPTLVIDISQTANPSCDTAAIPYK